MQKISFSKTEIKRRRLFRLAQIIHDHWQESSGMDTRYFDHPFIHDDYVVTGRSNAGGTYREHVVPRAYLRDECMRLLDAGATIEQLTDILEKNLKIVLISEDKEAKLLNLTLKTTMPDGWILGLHDPMDRLTSVGIQVIENAR